MNAITITKPTLDDVEIMFAWGEQNSELWSDKESKWYSKEGIKEWIEHPLNDVLFAARVDGVLAGMSTTHILHGWAFCDGLYVSPDYRKLGIGRMLLEKTEERVKALHVGNLSLLCDTENTAGLALYEKVGFKEGLKFIWMYKNLKQEGP
jgi:ribosomal protein S18 acetylase RimI-like enzyme